MEEPGQSTQDNNSLLDNHHEESSLPQLPPDIMANSDPEFENPVERKDTASMDRTSPSKEDPGIIEPDEESVSINESSLSEANPPSDTFHTPSASLQNLAENGKKAEELCADESCENESKNVQVAETAHQESEIYESQSSDDIFELSIDTRETLEDNVVSSGPNSGGSSIIQPNKLYLDLSKFEKEGLSLTQGLTPDSPGALLGGQFVRTDSSGESSLIVISKCVTPTTDLSISVDSNNSSGVVTGATGVMNRTASSGSIVVGSQNSSNNAKKIPGKKKMWYQQIFSTSYKTRSAEFKRIFKDLSAKERLIVGKLIYVEFVFGQRIGFL